MSLPFAEYEVALVHPSSGELLDVLDLFTSLIYIKRVNDVGAFELVLSAEDFDISFAQLDARVVVWRKPPGGSRSIDFAGFLRSVSRRYKKGVHEVVLQGPDYNDVLVSRIVAYAAASTQSSKDDYADDMMKEVVDENLGTSATDTDRDLETAWGLSIQINAGLGTSIEKAFSWSNVLQVLQEIAESSQQTPSTQVFFGMVPMGSRGWEMEFQTNVPHWGEDHSHPGGIHGIVVFALERGNMAEPELAWDRRGEWNYVYGGGQGEEEDRVIVEVEDTPRVVESPFNRREAFYDGRSYKLRHRLRHATRAKLNEGYPLHSFDFTPVDVTGCVYGLHWGFGDMVTASYLAEQSDFHVAAVRVTVRRDSEQLRTSFEEFPA